MTAGGSGPLPLVIVGAGGFGREVLQLVLDINAVAPTFDLLGFLDDAVIDAALRERLGAPVLGSSARLADLQAAIVIAVGSSAPRRRLDQVALAAGRRAVSLVHPSATVGRNVTTDEGTVIAAGSRVTANVTIGRHAHINVNCSIGHDVVVEDYVSVYPGVHVGGGCTIGRGATLGMGSVVLPDVRIGRGAVVGAGAIVARDVAPDTTVVGPVARPTLRAQTRPDEAPDEREVG